MEMESVMREFEELTQLIRHHKAGQREAAVRRREIILEMRGSGMSDSQIGEALGLSRQRIERIRAGRDLAPRTQGC